MQIINDLERLIQSARDKVCNDQSTLSLPQELPSLPDELRMIGGMIYSAPVIAINPNSEFPHSCAPSHSHPFKYHDLANSSKCKVPGPSSRVCPNA